MSKQIKYIDIHGHINFPEYDADREEVIKRAIEVGVGMIVIGIDIESSKRAIELAETHENMWATVGIHPTEIVEGKSKEQKAKIKDEEKIEIENSNKGAEDAELSGGRGHVRAEQKSSEPRAYVRSDQPEASQARSYWIAYDFAMRVSADLPKVFISGASETLGSRSLDFEDLRRLALHPKVVAIGECGLDYFHCQPADIPAQIEAFEKHIAIANEAGKPLMLHVRNGKKKSDADADSTSIKTFTLIKTGHDAYGDALNILKKSAKVPFNFHFFAGSMEDIKNIIKVGGTVSFTGVLTFTHDYDELVKAALIEHIMSETDCPYVAPVPYRGKRNEPAYVIEVVKTIARIRGEDEEKVRAILLENARRFFRLK
jgi:TatD DNase family protein